MGALFMPSGLRKSTFKNVGNYFLAAYGRCKELTSKLREHHKGEFWHSSNFIMKGITKSCNSYLLLIVELAPSKSSNVTTANLTT